MKTLNIRNEANRAYIEASGWKWVTVEPRGEDKGRVYSMHHTYEAAEKAAKELERTILNVADGWMF